MGPKRQRLYERVFLPESQKRRTGRAANLGAAELDAWCAEVPSLRVHASLGAFAEHLLSLDPTDNLSMPGVLQ